MKTLVIAALLFAASCANAQQCGNHSARHIKGHEPLASRLYIAARKADAGAWHKGSFESESSTYLGDVRINGKLVHVLYLQTIWGPACRVTTRLVFFSFKLKPLSWYSGTSEPAIKGNSLVFFPEHERRSEVDLSKGLPKQIDAGDDFYDIEVIPNNSFKPKPLRGSA
jgi:hypothetical protein